MLITMIEHVLARKDCALAARSKLEMETKEERTDKEGEKRVRLQLCTQLMAVVYTC